MDEIDRTTRRQVLAAGAVTTAALAGFTGSVVARGNGRGNGGAKGGAGLTFTEPTVDTFSLTGTTNTDLPTAYFQRGCGNDGDLKPYDLFYAVDSFDGDGETDRLYPHPNDKEIGGAGDTFRVNTYCETEARLRGADRTGYWFTFSPV